MSSNPKYGRAHEKARARWKDKLDELGSLPCCLCPKPVYPWQRWHLDHVPGTVDQYRGVAHGSCNEGEGARRGNKMRNQRAEQKKVQRLVL